MKYVLRTKDICKNYKDFKALNGLTMNVPQGSIYGFVGKNGAGKTTLIRLVCGMQLPTSGELELYGAKLTDKEMSRSRRRMGAVVETPSIYYDMTAVDNLKQQYRILGLPSFDGIDDILKLVGLEDIGKKKAKHFSLGMRQRLGIGLALIGDPKLIILDEPINGLDPQGIVEVRQMLAKLRDEKGITIMISSHILDELGKLADSYGIIHEGYLIDEFTTDDLHKRCGQYILVKTDDNESAIKILKAASFEKSEIDKDGFIRISERLDDVKDVVKLLVSKDVVPKHVSVSNISLEDYYLSVTGGKHNG